MLAFEGRQVFSPLLRSICSAFSSRPTPVAAPPRKKLLLLARLPHFLMSPLVASPSTAPPPFLIFTPYRFIATLARRSDSSSLPELRMARWKLSATMGVTGLIDGVVAPPSAFLIRPPRARIGMPGGIPGGPGGMPIGGGGGPPGPAMGSGPAAGPPGAGPPPFGRTIAMLVLPPPFLTLPPRANRCDDLLPAMSLSRDAALLLVSLLKAWPLACFSAPTGEPERMVPTRR